MRAIWPPLGPRRSMSVAILLYRYSRAGRWGASPGSLAQLFRGQPDEVADVAAIELGLTVEDARRQLELGSTKLRGEQGGCLQCLPRRFRNLGIVDEE